MNNFRLPSVLIMLTSLSLVPGFARQPGRPGWPDSPMLTVRIYKYAPTTGAVLASAAAEAALVLRSAGLRLNWLDCYSPEPSTACASSDRPDFITVRLLPVALPEASQDGLGMAMSSASGSSAALFYDRAIALRRPGLFVSQILGRAMAHELIHVLVPGESHSHFGLMRAQWTSTDTRIGNLPCLGLSQRTVELLHKEVVRRALAAGERQNTRTD